MRTRVMEGGRAEGRVEDWLGYRAVGCPHPAFISDESFSSARCAEVQAPFLRSTDFTRTGIGALRAPERYVHFGGVEVARVGWHWVSFSLSLPLQLDSYILPRPPWRPDPPAAKYEYTSRMRKTKRNERIKYRKKLVFFRPFWTPVCPYLCFRGSVLLLGALCNLAVTYMHVSLFSTCACA